jgi:hypothetical protein
MVGTDRPASPVGSGAGGAAIRRDVADRQCLAAVLGGDGFWDAHGRRIGLMSAGRQGRSHPKATPPVIARCGWCQSRAPAPALRMVPRLPPSSINPLHGSIVQRRGPAHIHYRVTLTQYERNELGVFLGGGKHPARKLKRADPAGGRCGC